jgi:hypothetical protein
MISLLDSSLVVPVAVLLVFVGISALGIAGYGAFRMVAPGVTGTIDTFEKQQGLSQLLAYGAVVGACIALFRAHFWNVRDPRETPQP